MNAMQELKQLLNQTKRKTLPIEKIEPLIKEIEKMYIQTGKKLSQEKEMNSALRNINGQLAIRLGMRQMPDSEIKRLFQLKKNSEIKGLTQRKKERKL